MKKMKLLEILWMLFIADDLGSDGDVLNNLMKKI